MEKELEYELTTIKDIFDKVPSDRIRVCLHELGIAMEQTKAMAELLGATAEVVTGVSDGVAVRWPETSPFCRGTGQKPTAITTLVEQCENCAGEGRVRAR